MSRSDLLIQLVQSGGRGDKLLFKKVIEAIIAEERSKQHNTFADKLQESLDAINFSSLKNHSANGILKVSEGNNLLYEINPALLVDDLVLAENTKRITQNFIEEQLRADLLRSYNMEPRNRLLLIGPPGNGKTSLAEAIAGDLMIPLLSVRYESIIASYLGETSVRLKNLFDYVRTQKCVLFFDEFDSIGKERGDIHETGEIKRVVSSLLLQIDMLPSYVVIVAATNHPELLDRAVWRRFQLKIILPKPTIKEAAVYLSNYQNKFDIRFGYSSEELAAKLKGMSYSEIKDFCDDIVRKYILSIPGTSKNVKKITSEKLSLLKSSYKPQS